jgi:hypothetical protein
LNLLIQIKQAELQMHLNKLNEINGCVFMRTASEKESQLAAEYLITNRLKVDLQQLQAKLDSLQ